MVADQPQALRAVLEQVQPRARGVDGDRVVRRLGQHDELGRHLACRRTFLQRMQALHRLVAQLRDLGGDGRVGRGGCARGAEAGGVAGARGEQVGVDELRQAEAGHVVREGGGGIERDIGLLLADGAVDADEAALGRALERAGERRAGRHGARGGLHRQQRARGRRRRVVGQRDGGHYRRGALSLRRGVLGRDAVQLGAGEQSGPGHHQRAHRHCRARPARPTRCLRC